MYLAASAGSESAQMMIIDSGGSGLHPLGYTAAQVLKHHRGKSIEESAGPSESERNYQTANLDHVNNSLLAYRNNASNVVKNDSNYNSSQINGKYSSSVS